MFHPAVEPYPRRHPEVLGVAAPAPYAMTNCAPEMLSRPDPIEMVDNDAPKTNECESTPYAPTAEIVWGLSPLPKVTFKVVENPRYNEFDPDGHGKFPRFVGQLDERAIVVAPSDALIPSAPLTRVTEDAVA